MRKEERTRTKFVRLYECELKIFHSQRLIFASCSLYKYHRKTSPSLTHPKPKVHCSLAKIFCFSAFFFFTTQIKVRERARKVLKCIKNFYNCVWVSSWNRKKRHLSANWESFQVERSNGDNVFRRLLAKWERAKKYSITLFSAIR